MHYQTACSNKARHLIDLGITFDAELDAATCLYVNSHPDPKLTKKVSNLNAVGETAN